MFISSSAGLHGDIPGASAKLCRHQGVLPGKRSAEPAGMGGPGAHVGLTTTMES